MTEYRAEYRNFDPQRKIGWERSATFQAHDDKTAVLAALGKTLRNGEELVQVLQILPERLLSKSFIDEVLTEFNEGRGPSIPDYL